MNLRKRILCGVLLCMCLMLSGCGAKLFQMTADEENQIVLYAAKMVSKYNRAQDKGYANVEADTKALAEENKVVEEEEPSDTEETQLSFSDIIGLEGVTFTYTGYDVATTYETEDVVIPDAESGYSYIILHIEATNTTDEDIAADLLSKTVKYKLSINDNVVADCVSTLSMEDLSTYYNKSLGAGETDDTVLLFKAKTDYLYEISSLVLEVTKDGQLYNVKL